MASVLCDVSLWLEHAKEVRALSDVTSDPEEKKQMLVVAAGFDRIAELAREHASIQAQHQLSDRSTSADFGLARGFAPRQAAEAFATSPDHDRPAGLTWSPR